jgi:hypothetical protein
MKFGRVKSADDEPLRPLIPLASLPMTFSPDKYALKNWKATACIGVAVGMILLILNVLFGPPSRHIGILEGIGAVVGWTAAAFFVNALCYGNRT